MKESITDKDHQTKIFATEKENNIKYSFVIPIYNEEESIPELYRRLTEVLENFVKNEKDPLNSYEIIMVDDGSMDNSWKLIEELHETDSRIKGISFSRNFGHHAAVLAGIDHSRGYYTTLMDADLQDPPEEIPRLIEKAKEGYDLVQGISSKRHVNVFHNFVSLTFHKLFVKMATVDPRTRLGIFRCMNRPVVESIKKLSERSIFLGGLISWVGFKTAYITLNRAPRFAGKSKYNIFKKFALALNAIISFSERPLVFIFQLGMSAFVFSFFMFGYTIFKKVYYNVAVMGWTSLFAAIFFSTGLITLSVSVVGLYISKLFIEIKQRPRYIIKELKEEDSE